MISKESIEKLINNPILKGVSIIVALLAGFIGIYSNFFIENGIRLEHQIISESNVLDQNEDIGNLEIFYDSTSLNLNKQNLKIFTVRTVNKGKESILKSYYDENEPLGLKIDSGKIIKAPEIISSSNDYLFKNVNVRINNDREISFSNIIFDHNESFTIKFLVLHNNGYSPKIVPTGKLAGQKQILISNLIESDKEKPPTILDLTIFGGIWVQLIRLFVYGVIFIFILLLLIEITEKKESTLIEIRKNIVQKYIDENDIVLTKKVDLFFNDFITNGLGITARYGDIYNYKKIDTLMTRYEKLELSPYTNDIINSMIDLKLMKN